MVKHSYAWRGNGRDGQPIHGVIAAQSKNEVAQQLREQRIRATHIQRQFHWRAWLQTRPQPRIKPNDTVRLTRQLATLLKSGVPLLQALQILQRSESALAVKTMIQQMHTDIESGVSLSLAAQRHAAFDALFCNLVAVGEISGTLDVMLERLAHHLEKAAALRATLRSALIYPCAVLSIALAVLTLILVFVVPAFQNIFASLGAELPWLTRVVIDLSQGVQNQGVVVVAVAGAAAWMLRRRIQQRPTWRRQFELVLLRTPLVGTLLQNACTARWTRTLATLFTAGVPLTEALDSVQGVTGHLLFQQATQTIQSQLMQGTSLSQALDNAAPLFPPMVVQMCAIGEESGSLDLMLDKTAQHYECEVDHTVARLSTLLEPVIMVVLGVLIGTLVMALYLPIFQLGQVV